MRRPYPKDFAPLVTPVLPLVGNRTRHWLTRQFNPLRKQYIPSDLSVADFFARLDALGHKVVVLRWFENLPQTERGRDLDVLISDETITAVQDLLSEWPVGQRIDCYSETGARGTGYLPSAPIAIPAFPQEIAMEILRTARRQTGGWWVPAPREHALALAYHAVYLKGYASGLAPDLGEAALSAGSHDYATIITGLCAAAGITLDSKVTMRSIDRMLALEGWQPSEEHLVQLATVNPWIARTLL